MTDKEITDSSDKDVVKLTVENSSLNFEVEKKLANFLINLQHYEELSDTNIKVIQKCIKKINKKYYPNILKKEITLRLCFSMRSAYLKERIIKNYYILDKKRKKILYLYYEKNQDLLTISNHYKLSPLTVFRYILKATNGKKKYDKIKKDFKKHLSKRDYEQMNIGIEHDVVAPFDQDRIAELSQEFEEKLEKYLKDNGVKYKTQEMLQEEQTKQFGRPINTPDFLILSDLYINDKKINWIDAKNFYGAATFLIKKKLNKQTRKYIDKWGYGSVVFSLGYSSKLKHENILFLDYSLL